MRSFLIFCVVFITLIISLPTRAQSQLAATLEVLSPGVEVLRVNTTNPIAVQVEAIVGVGDIIRTDDTGEARITFFADGTDTTVLPNTEYQIMAFEGDDEAFVLQVEVLVGQTTQRLSRLLNAQSTYDVQTPGMTLGARGTEFAIRVEQSGRAAMLVREGAVEAETEGDTADVPAEFGIRSEDEGPLSDVVRASTFDELDAALDGCTATITTVDDVSLNVRLGPSIDLPRLGTIDDEAIDTLIGTDASGSWYRIPYRGGFGWVLSSGAEIASDCAGLRLFPADQLEDPDLYNELGETIDPSEFALPEATSEPEPDEPDADAGA